MVGLIGAGSATPLDVEAAAAIVSTVLLGRTASAAAKTLKDATAVRKAPADSGSAAMVVAEALLAWKKGSGPMQVRLMLFLAVLFSDAADEITQAVVLTAGVFVTILYNP